jgi:anti-sigma28 factor (negative regulator of flagellin synthesis)
MRLQLDPALTGNGVTSAGEAGQTAPAGGSASGSTGVQGVSSGVDSIQISGPTAALNRLSADRTARIQQLTALVRGGSYQVSSSLVGSAIVNDAVS